MLTKPIIMNDYLSTVLPRQERFQLKSELGQEKYNAFSSLVQQLDQFEGDNEEEQIIGDWMDVQGQLTTLKEFKKTFFDLQATLLKNLKTQGELYSIVKNITDLINI